LKVYGYAFTVYEGKLGKAMVLVEVLVQNFNHWGNLISKISPYY